jgi:2-iminoacetate synthase ThiH
MEKDAVERVVSVSFASFSKAQEGRKRKLLSKTDTKRKFVFFIFRIIPFSNSCNFCRFRLSPKESSLWIKVQNVAFADAILSFP